MNAHQKHDGTTFKLISWKQRLYACI